MLNAVTQLSGRFAEYARKIVRRVGPEKLDDAELLASSPLFDQAWYRAQYPDVASSGMSPIAHYLTRGAADGCDPSPAFESRWYLEQNPDVAATGMNPLCHYLRHGSHEGRWPNRRFDPTWYRTSNPDVAAASVEPLTHYIMHGAAEGRWHTKSARARSTSTRFGYLIDKLERAEIRRAPYSHIYIENFFNEDDFSALTKAPEVAFAPASSDVQLFEYLATHGYKALEFPGCITDAQQYMQWHSGARNESWGLNNSACEGFGMTFRLMTPRTAIIEEVLSFTNSHEFNALLAEKLDINFAATYPDSGLQKYLDGYEISPHPDIRRKAATYMVNINPGTVSESQNHHTHYMQFKAKYKFIEEFWRGNHQIDTCWVPWDWCETKFEQRRNNSIVVFRPSDDTLHAVKARYDHLRYQRTQLYGNLWYKDPPNLPVLQWEDFCLERRAVPR